MPFLEANWQGSVFIYADSLLASDTNSLHANSN